MSTKTQYSVSDIAKAKITGKSSQTVRRELKNRHASTTAKGKSIYVELSELMRIYTNDELDFMALGNPIQKQKAQLPSEQTNPSPTKQPHYSLDIELLQEKLNSAEKQILQYQDDIDYLKKTIDKALDNQHKTVALLEDKSTSSGGGDIEKLLKTLESRIEKQEQSAKDEAAEKEKIIQQEKERADKALSEKQDYQKATKLLYAFTGFLILIVAIGLFLYSQGVIDIRHNS